MPSAATLRRPGSGSSIVGSTKGRRIRESPSAATPASSVTTSRSGAGKGVIARMLPRSLRELLLHLCFSRRPLLLSLFALAIASPRLGVRVQHAEQVHRGVRDGLDRLVERRLVLLRRLGHPRHLAHVL